MEELRTANSRNSIGRHPALTNGADSTHIVPSLLSIAKSTRAFLTLVLAEIDLHPGQDQLLARLEPESPLSVSALADLLAVRPSTVSKMLDRLIEKRLVMRAASNRDARRTMVMLTQEGEQAKRLVKQTWDRLEAELVASLDRAEVEKVTSALDQVDELLTAKLRRLR